MMQLIDQYAKRLGMVMYKFMEIGRRDSVWRAFTSGFTYLSRVANPAEVDDFDRIWNVSTSGATSLWHMSIDSPNAKFGAAYSPSEPEWIERGLACLREDFSTFDFIDLGCGKGRALLVASHYGFRKLIGVEFAAELVEEARRNLQLSGINAAEIIREDAANFLFPDGNLAVYLFNPFSSHVLRPVLDRLAGRRGRHKTYLIYVNPLHASLVDITPGFQPVATFDGAVSVRIWTCA